MKKNLRLRSAETFQKLLRGGGKILRSASGAVFLTILATIIGLVGGLYATELRTFYPWCLIEGKTCATGLDAGWRVGGFYTAFFVFALAFYLRERGIAVHADQRENDLMVAIRTMPPANVMQSFEATYKIFMSHVEASDLVVQVNDKNLAEIDEGIRNGLDAMTVLAAQFQRVPGARYAANIMLFRPIADIPENEHQGVITRLGSFIDSNSMSGLSGVLDLQVDLSASTDEEDSFDKDSFLKPMALPLPEEEKSKNNGQKRYLPGAPTALIEGNYLVDDTHQLLSSYENNKDYDLTPGVFQHIDFYFRNTPQGQLVRSMMSLVLYFRKPGAEGDEIKIGVVNVHSNRVNLFASRELAAHYESLCQPFILGLARMIKNRKRIQELSV